MVDNSNMPHPKCLGSQKNPGTEPKTCEKGPKLGFEYLPTSKTSHCVRTACMAFPKSTASILCFHAQRYRGKGVEGSLMGSWVMAAGRNSGA